MKWAARVPRSFRPAILNQKHTDWPKLLRWVPRSWTAFIAGIPKKVAGNAPLDRCTWGCLQTTAVCERRDTAYPKPIPDPGFWWLGRPFYFAFQTKGRIHARIGFRYDDVDGYYTFTIQPYKRYKVAPRVNG